jgi:hypothetical protein
MDWYRNLYDVISNIKVSWANVDKAGSNLADLAIRLHSSLQNILGTGQYHISSSESAAIAAATGTGNFVKANQPTIAMEAVIAPTLINSWANTGGANLNAGYWKDPFGMVHIHGIISGGAASTVAFVLPVGYRPGGLQNYPTIQAGAASFLSIDASGNVNISGTGNCNMSISFRAV